MAKTRLTQSTRESIVNWMMEQVEQRILKQLETLPKVAIEAINKAIRVKYPQTEMEILRKYACTGKDTCLRFVNPKGQVFGIELGY